MIRRFGAVATLAILAVGCNAPGQGWERLWPDDWTLHNDGVVWVSGVPAAGREFGFSGRSREFRGELLNTGSSPVTVRILGPGRGSDWSLEPGEYRMLETNLRAGSYRIEAPPQVVLGSPRLGRPMDDPRMLVVVLVDTLRDDHVTAELMPGVSAFFNGGRRWHAVQANSSWTLPSVASFFTARPVLDLTSPAGEIIGVPEGLPVWAEVLDEAGFVGGGVVANYTVHALNGFAAGFSSYLVPDGRGSGEAPDCHRVVDRARSWLVRHRGEDAFLYLHLMDPHEPYRDHTEAGRTVPPLRPLARGERAVTDEEHSLLRELYAGEVSHVDRVLTEFLGELPDHAVVVFTSDHGEGLGEHGAWSHGLELHQETLSVPLMISGPGVEAGDDDTLVQLLDLGPTLLDLVGVRPDPSMIGRSLVEGGSDEPVVSATFSAGPLRWAWRRDGEKVVIRMAEQPGLGAVSRTRLIEVDPPSSGGTLIDLRTDPDEGRPGPIPPELMPEVGAAFARTAGRMVPGMQLMLWGGSGFTTQTLAMTAEIDVVQAWSSAGIAVNHADGMMTITCADAELLCAVAAAADSIPRTVIPMGERNGWAGLESSVPVDPRDLGPPDRLGPGWNLWWNPDRALVVGGHDETIERLRALGYIE